MLSCPLCCHTNLHIFLGPYTCTAFCCRVFLPKSHAFCLCFPRSKHCLGKRVSRAIFVRLLAQVFTSDYLLKIACAPFVRLEVVEPSIEYFDIHSWTCRPMSRLQRFAHYFKESSNVIDLLAVLPWWCDLMPLGCMRRGHENIRKSGQSASAMRKAHTAQLKASW